MGSPREVESVQTVDDFVIQTHCSDKTYELLPKLTGLTGICDLVFGEPRKVNQETHLQLESVLRSL